MLELQQIRAQLLFTDSNVVTMATVFDLPPEVSSEDLTASWNLSVSVFFFVFFFVFFTVLSTGFAVLSTGESGQLGYVANCHITHLSRLPC